MMTMNKMLSKILSAKNIALFAHKNPDPDAYGSLFAMKEICQNLGKKTDIFAIRNKPGYLDNIFPLDDIKTEFSANEYDLVILLDLHLLSRVAPDFISEIEKSTNVIVVDHHKVMEGDVVASKTYLEKEDYAATCEILTDFCDKMELKITPKIATYLYTGLMGDTDRFLHNNLTKHVFETAILLYEKKAKVQTVYDYLYRYQTKEQLNLYQFLLNTMKYMEDGKAAYVIYTLKDLKEMNADQEDVKMYTNDMVKIKGVELSFLCIEYSRNFYKFSVRSNGVNTVDFSTRMGGGGHKCASAFEKKATKTELKKLIPIWVKEILNG